MYKRLALPTRHLYTNSYTHVYVLHGVFVYNVVSVIKLYRCLFAFVSVCEKLVLEHGANVQEENCKRYYSN
ncbi:unnamed protein product [Acanthoscelides obtectus]|uniref:Uncharacterized protein n=1 Tax=Acanthoscelides obtectus TaxID=200917 RepID=A0A9P0K8H5_ACAOB|nr:unnamed protein product [Acanthoscelides obtectus]CAK1665874.1 hypothetical protein AOBTE_LOCUS25017 [Acanthoscelides obtectus]